MSFEIFSAIGAGIGAAEAERAKKELADENRPEENQVKKDDQTKVENNEPDGINYMEKLRAALPDNLKEEFTQLSLKIDAVEKGSGISPGYGDPEYSKNCIRYNDLLEIAREKMV